MKDAEISVIRNKVEEVWIEILGLEEAETETHFIELGGTSIAAEQVAARIAADVGIDITGYEILALGSLREVQAEIVGRCIGVADGYAM